MKNIKTMIVFGCMLIFTAGLSAKKLANKDQVFFTNEYGADVAMVLVWQGDSIFSLAYEDDYILRDNHKEIMLKAPYSGCHLVEIEVTPVVNTQGKDLINAAIFGANVLTELATTQTAEEKRQARKLTQAASHATELAYEVSKSANKDTLKVRNDTFFIIEKSHEKSKISGQKKIRIREYATKEHYQKEIARVESKESEVPVQAINLKVSAEQQPLNKDFTQESLALEQKKLALQQEQLAFEEKQLAFKEKLIAFEKNNSSILQQGGALAA